MGLWTTLWDCCTKPLTVSINHLCISFLLLSVFFNPPTIGICDFIITKCKDHFKTYLLQSCHMNTHSIGSEGLLPKWQSCIFLSSKRYVSQTILRDTLEGMNWLQLKLFWCFSYSKQPIKENALETLRRKRDHRLGGWQMDNLFLMCLHTK